MKEILTFKTETLGSLEESIGLPSICPSVCAYSRINVLYKNFIYIQFFFGAVLFYEAKRTNENKRVDA